MIIAQQHIFAVGVWIIWGILCCYAANQLTKIPANSSHYDKTEKMQNRFTHV